MKNATEIESIHDRNQPGTLLDMMALEIVSASKQRRAMADRYKSVRWATTI